MINELLIAQHISLSLVQIQLRKIVQIKIPKISRDANIY